MTMYSYIEEVASNQANIKVIGIGGGGCNAVQRMMLRQIKGIEFIACNTDMQSLQQYHAQTCLQLGRNLTRGLGAGGNPKIGRAAALEDEEMIRSHLAGADMVFITAGMGGGTGTGGAPVVAQIARDLGILTVAVVTLPFRFEGSRRYKIAETGLRNLEEYVDTLIIVPNQKILAAVEPDTSVRDAFTKADEILSNAVQGISDLIIEPGEVNVDFADVQAIMTGMGKAILGTGIGSGENRAVVAVDNAISSPFLETAGINGARGVLINITSGDDFTMVEMHEACERISQAADEEALIIFGHVYNQNYNGQLKITIIATGFEKPRVREDDNITIVSHESLHVQTVSQRISPVEQHLPRRVAENKPTPETVRLEPAPSHLRMSPPEPIAVSPSPELTHAKSKPPHRQPVQPELDIPPKRSRKDDIPVIPDYNQRDMGAVTVKKDSRLDGIARRIYYGDINTPAFLRRKAD